MAIEYTQPGGWLHQQERRDLITQWETPILYGLVSDSDLPERVDPTGWMQIEDQRNQGACQGHALSTGVECVHALAGGTIVQLSRACAYYLSQRLDGIRGDQGSTIAGGIKLAEQDGICLESVWPYPSSYNPREPEGYRSATKWKIANHSPIRSSQECIKHIGLHGAVHIGIMWSSDIDKQVSQRGIVYSYRPGGGGHSVELIGYSPTDWDGKALEDTHVMLFNSWSKSWGRNGVALVSPNALQSMIENRNSVFVGLYGAPHPEIKRPHYEEL